MTAETLVMQAAPRPTAPALSARAVSAWFDYVNGRFG